MRRSIRRLAVFAAAAAASFGLQAQTVSLGGSLGDKALLVIDGAPRTVKTGDAVRGVKLVSVNADSAVVELGGRRLTLQLGGAQVTAGAASGAGATQIVLSAGTGGHFWTMGAINGRAVEFIVDTGATNVSISRELAERLGVDLKTAQRGVATTANGQVMAWRVMLDSVRVGEVQVYNVAATVMPVPMSQVLLGNSFLSRFQMTRENDTMVLTKRF
jgi:aspartyl protease family protein